MISAERSLSMLSERSLRGALEEGAGRSDGTMHSVQKSGTSVDRPCPAHWRKDADQHVTLTRFKLHRYDA
eukprot:2192992-Rhodomonas_salina.1